MHENYCLCTFYILITEVDAIATAMIDLNTSLTYVKDNATALGTAATNLKDGIDADKTSCGTTCDNAPDVSTLKVEVDASAVSFFCFCVYLVVNTITRRGHCGRDRKVVGFKTTYAVSGNHH